MRIPENTIVRPIHFHDSVSWASMRKGDTWCVWFNKHLQGYEKEFIIAHELWHLIDDTCGINHHFAEKRANEIARRMLISLGELRGYIEDWFTTISELSLFFPSATPDMIERSCKEIIF